MNEAKKVNSIDDLSLTELGFCLDGVAIDTYGVRVMICHRFQRHVVEVSDDTWLRIEKAVHRDSAIRDRDTTDEIHVQLFQPNTYGRLLSQDERENVSRFRHRIDDLFRGEPISRHIVSGRFRATA